MPRQRLLPDRLPALGAVKPRSPETGLDRAPNAIELLEEADQMILLCPSPVLLSEPATSKRGAGGECDEFGDRK